MFGNISFNIKLFKNLIVNLFFICVLTIISYFVTQTLTMRTGYYYKRDYFHFPIVNFPFMCSNMWSLHVYLFSYSNTLIDIPDIVVPIMISQKECYC